MPALLTEMDNIYPDAVKNTVPKFTSFTCAIQSGGATVSVYDAQYSSGATAQTFFVSGSYLPTESEWKAANSLYGLELIAHKNDGTQVVTDLTDYILYATAKSIVIPINDSKSFGTTTDNHRDAYVQLSKSGTPVATLPLSLA